MEQELLAARSADLLDERDRIESIRAEKRRIAREAGECPPAPVTNDDHVAADRRAFRDAAYAYAMQGRVETRLRQLLRGLPVGRAAAKRRSNRAANKVARASRKRNR